MTKDEFGKRLRQDMHKRGLTYRKLSGMVDIPERTLSNIAAGRCRLYWVWLEKLAKMFDYPERILPRADGRFPPDSNESPEENADPEKRPKPYCSSCKYLWEMGEQFYCLYCHDTGEPRSCLPIECKEKGRWEPAKGKRKGGDIPWSLNATSKPSKRKTKP